MNVLNLIHKNITRLFKEAGIDFYDIPEINVNLPFARLADVDLKVDNFGNFETYNVGQVIHLWSDYEGKRELNEMFFKIKDYVDKKFEFECDDNFVLVGFKLNNDFNIVDLDGLKQGVIKFDIMIDMEVM